MFSGFGWGIDCPTILVGISRAAQSGAVARCHGIRHFAPGSVVLADYARIDAADLEFDRDTRTGFKARRIPHDPAVGVAGDAVATGQHPVRIEVRQMLAEGVEAYEAPAREPVLLAGPLLPVGSRLPVASGSSVKNRRCRASACC